MTGYSPVEAINSGSTSAVLILCDHASNHVPAAVNGGDLGLPASEMARHIAYDVGARGVTLELARLLDAPALMTNFSRLVVDPNRGPDDPTLIMQLYDRTIIPANRHLDAAEVARRKASYHQPYHAAITARIDAMIAAGQVPHLVGIHSFTPQLGGRPPRPWHVGVLWDRDTRLAHRLMGALREDPDLCVGDNEPYSGAIGGDTMDTHGTSRGLPHVLIELRSDLIRTPEGQADWAARLAPLLARIIPHLDERKDGTDG